MGYMERVNKAKRTLIDTTKGLIEERLLTKKVDGGAVEYYLDGELVHRSATVELRGVQGAGAAQKF